LAQFNAWDRAWVNQSHRLTYYLRHKYWQELRGTQTLSRKGRWFCPN
jgi:hypothetical protein